MPKLQTGDPSTETRQWFGPTCPGRTMVKQGQTSVEYSNAVREMAQKNDFPELGLPGVESVPTPRGSISLALSVPPRPKTAKIQILQDFGVTPAPSSGAGEPF